tara:strand:+ start:494 stop:970 length:477 start_codon:yes stop_codon:yes gene_type:complete
MDIDFSGSVHVVVFCETDEFGNSQKTPLFVIDASDDPEQVCEDLNELLPLYKEEVNRIVKHVDAQAIIGLFRTDSGDILSETNRKNQEDILSGDNKVLKIFAKCQLSDLTQDAIHRLALDSVGINSEIMKKVDFLRMLSDIRFELAVLPKAVHINLMR